MEILTAAKTTIHYNVVLRHGEKTQTVPVYGEAGLGEALARYRRTGWQVVRVEKVTTTTKEVGRDPEAPRMTTNG